jgi:hypothetical protein
LLSRWVCRYELESTSHVSGELKRYFQLNPFIYEARFNQLSE